MYLEKRYVIFLFFFKWFGFILVIILSYLICEIGTMPEDFERYYGFTRFAIELNELDPETAKFLPCTDTRFRKDQRCA